MLVLLLPSAAAQVPSVPPYRVDVGGNFQVGPMVTPGSEAAGALFVMVWVTGEVQQGELEVEVVSVPEAPGWTIDVVERKVKIPLKGTASGFGELYEARLPVVVKAAPDARGDVPMDGAIGLRVKETTLTRAAEGQALVELRAEPIESLLVVGSPASLDATVDVPSTMTFLLRNDGNVPLTLALRDDTFEACSLALPPEQVVEPRTNFSLDVGVLCREAPDAFDPVLRMEVAARTLQGHHLRPTRLSVPVRVLTAEGEVMEHHEQLDLPLGWAAPLVAMAAVALARARTARR